MANVSLYSQCRCLLRYWYSGLHLPEPESEAAHDALQYFLNALMTEIGQQQPGLITGRVRSYFERKLKRYLFLLDCYDELVSLEVTESLVEKGQKQRRLPCLLEWLWRRETRRLLKRIRRRTGVNYAASEDAWDRFNEWLERHQGKCLPLSTWAVFTTLLRG